MLIQEIITEKLFRRSRRLYFTTLHADEMQQHRGITDSKLQTMLSQLEQNQDWLLYMRLQDFTADDTLLVYDPKSNLSAVVAYHKDSEVWKERRRSSHASSREMGRRCSRHHHEGFEHPWSWHLQRPRGD